MPTTTEERELYRFQTEGSATGIITNVCILLPGKKGGMFQIQLSEIETVDPQNQWFPFTEHAVCITLKSDRYTSTIKNQGRRIDVSSKAETYQLANQIQQAMLHTIRR